MLKRHVNKIKKPQRKIIPPENIDYFGALDHARIYPPACFVDGLFIPIQKGTSRNKAIKLQYELKEYVLHWSSKEVLGIQEQSIFLAIHRIASEQKNRHVLEAAPNDEKLIYLRKLLNAGYSAREDKCYYIETSLYEISKIIGLSDSGQNLKNIEYGLSKLANVICTYTRKRDNLPEWESNIFSAIKLENARILIAFSSMLCSAFNQTPTSIISMADQRKLKSECSKRLHMWLSSWANTDNHKVNLDTLIVHVWGRNNYSEVSKWNYRRTLRVAISEIGLLPGWTCTINENNLVYVSKPKLE